MPLWGDPVRAVAMSALKSPLLINDVNISINQPTISLR
ncbi:Hypothetical protein Y17_4707 [Pectobacterium wasabiae CFBP 3304]|nr:Hypothetical protein Y17_4707 [Pectobacterium wasabiae CFBP 3304]